MLPPGPGVIPVAPESISPPPSTRTLPAMRKTMGLSPFSLRTWLPLTVRPLSRTTMTLGPPPSWATLLVKSRDPSAQLVLVIVPAAESIVVVPAALQFQAGGMAQVAAHFMASTFTEGGTGMLPACLHPSLGLLA